MVFGVNILGLEAEGGPERTDVGRVAACVALVEDGDHAGGDGESVVELPAPKCFDVGGRSLLAAAVAVAAFEQVGDV